jgi:hypothetical protein
MAAASNNAWVIDRRCSGAITTANRIGKSKRAYARFDTTCSEPGEALYQLKYLDG